MGNDLSVYSVGRLVSRSHSRAVARVHGGTNLSLVRIDGEAQVQEAIVQGVASVGASAMRSIAMVSQLEVQLGQLVPAAVCRLQAIGDITGLAMAEVVSETSSRLNRAR